MEKDITLKEFKEAKARLREKIEMEIQEALVDFYKKTGERAYGVVSISYEAMQMLTNGTKIKHLEINVNLKTDL